MRRPYSALFTVVGLFFLLFGILLSFTFVPSVTLLFAAPTAASYTFIKDSHSQTTIKVSGEGAVVTLPEIQAAVSVTNSTSVVDLGNGQWRLNTNLLIGAGVTLNLSPQTGVQELQLRSGNSVLAEAATVATVNLASNLEANDEAEDSSGLTPALIDAIGYGRFVYLKSEDGTLNISDVKIYSWDAGAGKVDENYSDGRAYILARMASVMNIRNADIGYLGSSDSESYGLSWRDQNDPATPNKLRTRVTGELINSNIHHNYYGIYTYQAQNMRFVGNQFHHNIRYGFDPHDYSHDVLVENNVAYNNGAHGFIISRGCLRFTFRNNKSYDNFDPGSNQAHGFMLDPGGSNIGKPQVSSSFNLLENNEAYGNEGAGLRVLGSDDNEMRGNNFHHNNAGISFDIDSSRNNANFNHFNHNSVDGVQIKRGSISNTVVSNVIANNGDAGVALSENAKQNIVQQNQIYNNVGFGIEAIGSGTLDNRWSQNAIYANQLGGIRLASNANGNLAVPVLTGVINNSVSGTARPGAMVEIFADSGSQGQFYEGAVVAGSDGRFTFSVASAWQGNFLTAVTLHAGDASAFSLPVAAPLVITPTPSDTPTTTPTATETPTATVTTATIAETPTATETIVPVDSTGTPTGTATNTSISTAPPSTETVTIPRATENPQSTETPINPPLDRQYYFPVIQR